MDYLIQEFWSYAIPIAIVLAIYWGLEKLFSKLLPSLLPSAMRSKAATAVAEGKIVKTIVEIAKPKAVFAFEFREVSGEAAMAAFEAAKSEGKGIPVLINGGEHMRLGLAEAAAHRKPSTEDYLRMATAKPDPYASKSKPKLPAKWQEVGPFNDDGHPFLVKNYPEGFKPVVTLAFVPAQSTAEIPAHLKLGGWNAVPEADVSVALFRKWQADYGAEIVALSADAIDVRVKRKPKTREAALILAREHKKFCGSEVPLAEAAAELMEINWWHFYWD